MNTPRKRAWISVELWPKVVMGASDRVNFQVDTVAVKGQSEILLQRESMVLVTENLSHLLCCSFLSNSQDTTKELSTVEMK